MLVSRRKEQVVEAYLEEATLECGQGGLAEEVTFELNLKHEM